MINVPTWNQKIIILWGLNRVLFAEFKEIIGNNKIINKDKSNITTPPILLGIERKIA